MPKFLFFCSILCLGLISVLFIAPAPALANNEHIDSVTINNGYSLTPGATTDYSVSFSNNAAIASGETIYFAFIVQNGSGELIGTTFNVDSATIFSALGTSVLEGGALGLRATNDITPGTYTVAINNVVNRAYATAFKIGLTGAGDSAYTYSNAGLIGLDKLLVYGVVYAGAEHATNGWSEVYDATQPYDTGYTMTDWGEYWIFEGQDEDWPTGSYTLKIRPDSAHDPNYITTYTAVTLTDDTPLNQTINLSAATKQITGLVQNESGQGVVARVWALPAGGNSGYFLETDNTGNYSMYVAGGKTYEVGIENCYYADLDDDGEDEQTCQPWYYGGKNVLATFSDDTSIETQTISFNVTATTATVTGRMTYDNSGAATPLPGEVALYQGDAWYGDMVDDQGSFTVNNFPGAYRFTYWVDDSDDPNLARYYYLANNFSVAAGTNDLGTLTASEKTSTVNVTVTNGETGLPLSGIDVDFWLMGAGEATSSSTNASGLASFLAHESVYMINVFDPNNDYISVDNTNGVTVADNETKEISWQMSAVEASVNVEVDYPNGTIATDLKPHVHCWDETNKRGFGADIANGEGTIYALAGVYECRGWIDSATGYSFASADVALAVGDNYNLTMTLLENDAVITGWVKDQNGDKVTSESLAASYDFIQSEETGEAVLKVYAEGDHRWYEARVNDDGSFTLNLAAGAYMLGAKSEGLINAWGWDPTESNAVTAVSDQTVADQVLSIYLADSQITATVYAPNGTTTITDAQVNCGYWPRKQGDFDGGRVIESGAKTNTSGQAIMGVVSKDGHENLTYSCSIGTYEESNYLSPASQMATAGDNITFTMVERNSTITVDYTTPEGVTFDNVWCGAWAENSVANYWANDNNKDGSIVLYANSSVDSKWQVWCDGFQGKKWYNPTEATKVSLEKAGDYAAAVTMADSAYVIPDAYSEAYDATAEKTFQLEGLTLYIPANALDVSGQVKVNFSPRPTDIHRNSSNMVIGLPWDIEAFDSNDDLVTKLNTEAILTLHIDATKLADAGLTLDDLLPKYWDEPSGTWLTLEGFSIDYEAYTISMAINHFSEFSLMYNDHLAHHPKKIQRVRVPKKFRHSQWVKVLWKKRHLATKYQVQLKNKHKKLIKKFKGIKKHQKIIGKKWLKPHKTYWVRVRGVGYYHQLGPWSKYVRFRTKTL